jgi:tetratricopeptide (TPR) repeat protein
MPTHYFTYAHTSLTDTSNAPLGTVVVVRQKNPNLYEVGGFLLDCGCLGAKDAWYNSFDKETFEAFREDLFEKDFIERDGNWGRKLVEEGVAYAQRFGIKPHCDYKKAARVFGGINVQDCPEEFTFGRDGMPFFCPGPNDDAAAMRRVRAQLERVCGSDFHFMMEIDANEDPYQTEEDAIAGQIEPLLELVTEGKKIRWVIDRLRKIAYQNQDSAIAFYALGTALAVNKEHEKAVQAFDRSLELNPEFALAWRNKGAAHIKLTDLTSMITCYRNVMRFAEPGDEEYDSAEATLQQLAKNVKKNDGVDLESYYQSGLHFDKAWEHIHVKDWESALVEMRESARLNPRSYQASGNVGLCLIKLGRKDEAKEALRQSIKINPDYDIAVQNLRFLEQETDFDPDKIKVRVENSSTRNIMD